MNVSEMLKSRQLPALLSREEMVDILMKEEYGYMRDIPYSITYSDPKVIEARYGCNTVEHSLVEMTVTTEKSVAIVVTIVEKK